MASKRSRALRNRDQFLRWLEHDGPAPFAILHPRSNVRLETFESMPAKPFVPEVTGFKSVRTVIADMRAIVASFDYTPEMAA